MTFIPGFIAGSGAFDVWLAGHDVRRAPLTAGGLRGVRTDTDYRLFGEIPGSLYSLPSSALHQKRDSLTGHTSKGFLIQLNMDVR